MTGKDLKKLYEKIPDDAKVMVKMQGYGTCREAKLSDFNFAFSEESLTVVEDHYSHNNAPFQMIITDDTLSHNPGTWKILNKFKAILLKKSVRP